MTRDPALQGILSHQNKIKIELNLYMQGHALLLGPRAFFWTISYFTVYLADYVQAFWSYEQMDE